jgi:hypothetical protein
MKSKFVVAFLCLTAVLVASKPLTGQTTPSLAGSWQFTLQPGNPSPIATEPVIHALATFTTDGSVIESDSSEVVAILSPSIRSAVRPATAGHGIWQPAPAVGNLFIQFISYLVNPNATLFGRKTVTITGALDSSGNNFSGTYSYVLVDANGGSLGTGSGTVAGQRIPHPLLP